MSKTFRVLLRQLVVPAGEGESRLAARAAARLGCPVEDILSCRAIRRSLDARRRRGKAVHVYHVSLELPNRRLRPLRKAKHLDLVFEAGGPNLKLALTDPAPPSGGRRPLVVGAGPAGLFAALRLARAGWKPLLIERGDDMERRRSLTAAFWRDGRLDSESNALFGLGGAGLFSDGKLNTRHKDREGMAAILAVMVEAGAPENILVDAEPHVGSDLLGDVVVNIAAEIRNWGGEIRYRTRLDDVLIEDGRLAGVRLTSSGTEEALAVDACALAVGHSARDLYEALQRRNVALETKPFAIGLRVEVPQQAIDVSQRRGKFAPASGQAAAFRLSRAPEGGAAACYTFCMCPGGLVIPCASEPGRLCVNGMSYHARAGEWGNAAFLSPVDETDFRDISDPDVPPALRGMALQRHWEAKTWRAGLLGGDYAVPAMTLADFVAARSGGIPDRRGVARATAANLRELLPDRIGITLAAAIPAMLRRLHAVVWEEALLYAIETRTSSPVRIVRGDDGESSSVSGVFPAGEGSGYAGGIMTSALDGWKIAGKIMERRKLR